jgi:hypothetical protein
LLAEVVLAAGEYAVPVQANATGKLAILSEGEANISRRLSAASRGRRNTFSSTMNKVVYRATTVAVHFHFF